MSVRLGLYDVNLTIALPHELRDRVKALALAQGVSVSEIVRELLEAVVEDEERRQAGG